MSASSESLQDIPGGHVRLVLVLEPLFYLEIPIVHVCSLYLKPRKYLLFLGWCILGLEGRLTADGPDEPRIEDLDGQLVDSGLYYYTPAQGIVLDHAVDLEVIKERSAIPSETTRTRENFREKLLERDLGCVFTGTGPKWTQGVHIIPHRRVQRVGDLTDINDIRNAMLLISNLHISFDTRGVVILKTPNYYLDIDDVPLCPAPSVALDSSVTYPENERYSLQWLEEPDPFIFSNTPNNLDAAFKKHSRKPRPSALLLHYNYGAAAVRRWGHGMELFETHINRARPKEPELASMGPSKTSRDRSIAIRKHEAASSANKGSATHAAAGEQPRDEPKGTVGSRDQRRWDEDDLVLYFWGNSPAAMKRHRKKQEEKSRYLEQWRQGLPPVY